MTRRVNGKGRSEGEEQYFITPYAMAQSPAWRSLSGAACKVWIELRTRFHGANNGKLTLSYEEAAVLLGLSKSTVKRAFDELQEKGFIECMREGHWYGRRATEWATTDKGVGGRAATRKWRQWRPGVSCQESTTKTEIGTLAAPSACAIGTLIARNCRSVP